VRFVNAILKNIGLKPIKVDRYRVEESAENPRKKRGRAIQISVFMESTPSATRN
jgi:hypothetical protein